MKQTLINLTKLRIAGLLSEAAQREVEKKIRDIPEEDAQDEDRAFSFG